MNNFQKIVDFALDHQKDCLRDFLSDLKKQFTQFALLWNPELVGAFRTNTKIISNENEPLYALAKPYNFMLAENSVFSNWNVNRAVYRIGWLQNVSTSERVNINQGVADCPGTAIALQLVSTSLEDSVSGTGIQSIALTGIDGTDTKVTETITLNGTTPVTPTNQFAHVESLIAATVGSNRFAVGDVTLTDLSNTSIYAKVSAGYNMWGSGRFHTGKNDIGYIHSWTFGSYNSAMKYELVASNPQPANYDLGSVYARATGISNNNTINIDFPIPARIPSMGSVYVLGIAKSATNEATTSFIVQHKPL